jgi:hypothetical protein
VVQSSSIITTANPFALTFDQSVFGGLDHVKNLLFYSAPVIAADNGYMRYELTFTGQVFGTENHPFGADAVTDSQDDIRLASFAMNAVDFSTLVVADFVLSNTGVFAFYERLPFGKTESNNYQAFTSTKRVADRTVDQKHTLAIEYDKALKEIRWFVGNELVMTANDIGVPIAYDSQVKVILDHGGNPTTVVPDSFYCGWGVFSLLDMADPLGDGENLGLVDLTATPGVYAYPTKFVDMKSADSSRLFGQGAKIQVYKMDITKAPTKSIHESVCENFAVHAGTTVTFDGVRTTIHSGDVGVSPGTSITSVTPPKLVNGALDNGDTVFADSVLAAHAEAMEVKDDGEAMEIEMGGLTFTPGTHRSGSSINVAYGTVVTLDGLNEAYPVFFFEAVTTLVTAADTYFILKNGAKAENVLWALGSAATLGANSILEGSILAGTSITFGTKSELRGCALAQSAITFESEGSVNAPDL